MCAIIDTYVGTVVAMVFGGSVMGTLLCSSHLHPPPNSHTTHTSNNSPTSLSHNTSQQSTNGASAPKHVGEPKQYTQTECVHPISVNTSPQPYINMIHKYIGEWITPSKPYINTPVSEQLLEHVSPNLRHYPLNHTTF